MKIFLELDRSRVDVMKFATNFDGENRKSLIPYEKKSVLIRNSESQHTFTFQNNVFQIIRILLCVISGHRGCDVSDKFCQQALQDIFFRRIIPVICGTGNGSPLYDVGDCDFVIFFFFHLNP